VVMENVEFMKVNRQVVENFAECKVTQ